MNNSSRPGPDQAATPGDARLAATVVRPALPRYVLRGVSGAGFGRTFPLLGPTLLGRAPDCGIHLDHPGVSREHLRLTPTDEGLLVEDLGSTNGWLLNEQRADRALVHHGDELGVDTLRFRVIAPEVVAAPPAAVERPDRHRRAALWWLAALAVVSLSAVALALR